MSLQEAPGNPHVNAVTIISLCYRCCNSPPGRKKSPLFFSGYTARGDWLGSARLEALRECEWTNPVQGAVELGCDSDRVLREGISHSDHHWCSLHSKLQKYHSSESCFYKLISTDCIVFEHWLVLHTYNLLKIMFSHQAPMLVHALSARKIMKLAAHPDGQHYLALSVNGEVFSWGCGDGGRLGHGDTT